MRRLLPLFLALSGLLMAFLPAQSLPVAGPAERTFVMDATRFAFSPAVIRVNPGDRVTLILQSDDVVHGIYVDGYDLEVRAEPGQPATLTFTADQKGSFRLRCSVTCGALHPFMIGKLQVGTPVWWWRGLGLLLLGMATVFGVIARSEQSEIPSNQAGDHFGRFRAPAIVPAKFDLLRLPGLRRALTSRWPQFILRAIALAGFLFAMFAGLFGTPVGNRNFAIVAVWIAWWALLILLAVPFLGRAWCSICPIPLPGEWLQNRALLGPDPQKPPKARRRWPKALRNIWLQNAGFTVLALFSTWVLTSPRLTGAVLAALLLLALVIAWAYERRAFCRYLCPVGGFIGLYAQAAPIELRVKDTAVCAAHTTKACYQGNENGYGCPWGVFPAGMVRNNVCGLCFECLRTCDYDNLALNLRPPGSDLTQERGAKLDEAFKNFIMLGSALTYAALFLGPWGELKMAAYQLFSLPWLGYALGLLALTWGVLPALFALATCLADGRGRSGLRRAFTRAAYALTPLGLSAWVAFSLSFVFASFSYLWPALSDPLGWGWNLFGTAGASWQPYLMTWVPPLQAVTLTLGLGWSLYLFHRAAPQRIWPFALYAFTYAGVLLWLLTA